MGHQIVGERFISRTEPAWHKLGHVFEGDRVISASEAVAEVAGDVTVTCQPVVFEWGEEDEEGNKPLMQAKKERVVLRHPLPEAEGEDKDKPVVLGVVRDPNWVPTTYKSLAAGLDGLSKTHPVETAGLLIDGALCFLTLKAPTWEVAGDQMESYFIVNLSLQPGKGHNVMHAPVRVVCWNTNLAAEKSASINLSIPHTQDAAQKIGLAANLVARFETMSETAKEAFEAMARFEVSSDQIGAIFEAAFPPPPLPGIVKMLQTNLDPAQQELLKQQMDGDFAQKLVEAQESYDKGVQKAEALQDAAFERFEAFEPSRLGGTAWAAYNAVTEIADWREGRGEVEQSTVWGPRAKEKARGYVATAEIVGLG